MPFSDLERVAGQRACNTPLVSPATAEPFCKKKKNILVVLFSKLFSSKKQLKGLITI